MAAGIYKSRACQNDIAYLKLEELIKPCKKPIGHGN